MQHVFKLGDEDRGTVQQIDTSITSWSLELGRLELRLETVKAQLFGNYEARQNLLRKAVDGAGFDLKRVEDIRVGQAGQVLVVMIDHDGQSSDDPDGPTVDGVQTGPGAEPPDAPPEGSGAEPPAS
jgi:hypothetical protein